MTDNKNTQNNSLNTGNGNVLGLDLVIDSNTGDISARFASANGAKKKCG